MENLNQDDILRIITALAYMRMNKSDSGSLTNKLTAVKKKMEKIYKMREKNEQK